MAAQTKPLEDDAVRWRVLPWTRLSLEEVLLAEEQFFAEDSFCFQEQPIQEDALLVPDDSALYAEDALDLLHPLNVGDEEYADFSACETPSDVPAIPSSVAVSTAQPEKDCHISDNGSLIHEFIDPCRGNTTAAFSSSFSNPHTQVDGLPVIPPPINAKTIEKALLTASPRTSSIPKSRDSLPLFHVSPKLEHIIAQFIFSFAIRTEIGSLPEQETGINWDAVAHQSRKDTFEGRQALHGLYAVVEFLACKGLPGDADHLLNWMLSKDLSKSPSMLPPAQLSTCAPFFESQSTFSTPPSLMSPHISVPQELLSFLAKTHLAAFEALGMQAPERKIFIKKRKGQRATAHLQSAMHWFMQMGAALPTSSDHESPSDTFLLETLSSENAVQADAVSVSLTEGPNEAPRGAVFVGHGLRSLAHTHACGEVALTQLQESIEQDCTSAARERFLQVQKSGFLERRNPLAPTLVRLVEKWRVLLSERLRLIYEMSDDVRNDSSILQAQPLFTTLIANLGVEAISGTILSLLLMPGHEGTGYKGGGRRVPWWLPSGRAFIFGRLSLELGSRLLGSSPTNLMEWPAAQRVQVGSRLLTEALPLLRMDDGTPAFFHSVRRFRVNSLLGMLTINPLLSQHFGIPIRVASNAKDADRSESAKLGGETDGSTQWAGPTQPSTYLTSPLAMDISMSLPMVVPPRPWSSWRAGGYLLRRIPCFRIRDDPSQMAQVMMADARGKLAPLLEGLTFLGQTPWRINVRVLAVVRAAWQASSQTKAPETISTLASHAEALLGLDAGMRPDDRHSLWCDLNYRLMVADAISSYTEFFLPHNVDFRGRAYPIPALLSHMGSDLCRGLVLFGAQKAAPLGARGLHWLLIHLANMYGYDKASFEERLSWAQTHRAQIESSAADPINEQWWMAAEHPWQTLAACIEVSGAWAHPQGPEAFVTSIPVQQDGSCNGLQHYAALGRDPLGALHVNLVPGSRPADIYSAVATAVSQRIFNDAKSDSVEKLHLDIQQHAHNATNEASDRDIEATAMPLPGGVPAATNTGSSTAMLSRAEIARWILSPESGLPSAITRKIVKQSVMTSVYGVTLYGATQQIYKRLVEVAAPRTSAAAADSSGAQVQGNNRHMRQAARYIASLVFSSLGSMFDRSRRIQAWLTEVVTLVTASVPREWVARYFGVDTTQELTTLPPRSFNGPVEDILAGNKRPFAPSGLLRQFLNTKEGDAVYPRTLMAWTSPLGFPVVQPYREAEKVVVPTPLQMVTLDVIPDHETPVAVRQQIAAFAPNYIHSLDASHMFMTARRIEAHGIVFAAVHDSFWTHPKDTDLLHQELRAAFIELHSRPLLHELRSELIERFGNNLIPLQKRKVTLQKEEATGKSKDKSASKTGKRKTETGPCWAPVDIPQVPEQGSFVLEDVVHSPYFFN
ncbi:DNA-directed RNA polymerase [Mitosporidium daphniae]|uniref:DNA-directed RNA polymerase n=1 Tax=Mitosporidium daphniae TaxID=1485682 RepID=A0A098VR51_9MICR|nr:DNA-directed RNA polymerase [Mitosporidium daphniae]KGG51395.1 DNA-directed RNA polymerase [Mitosporidium daphniae]|eukprot:XP_013237839.1 DNA-directed RNA polymerase [Mitosporidium daphniae]